MGQKGHCRSRGLHFSMWKRKRKSSIWSRFFFVHHKIVSAVKRVEFVSDKVSCIVLRGRLSNIIVLNVHEPNEEKSDDSKDSFYEQFSKIFLSTLLKFC